MTQARQEARLDPDLFRLFDFMLERAQTAADFDAAQLAIDAITEAVGRSLNRTVGAD